MKIENRKFNRTVLGVTLLEIIIALTILSASALSIILIMRQGGAKGSQFTAEHFTAMFVSQKIMEDINFRCKENPHFFEKLIASASGDITDVVNSKSIFFNLLENTVNFSHLDPSEDKGIDKPQEPLFKQLEGFKCKVECEWVPKGSTGTAYTNLVEIFVTILWKEKNGKNRSYKISQMLKGTSNLTYRKLAPDVTAPFSDDMAGYALWFYVASASAPTPPDFSSFLDYNGSCNRDYVKAAGDLLYLSQISEQISSGYETKIDSLNQKIEEILPLGPSIALTTYKEQLAELYEQQASIIFLHFSKTLPSIDFLYENPPLTRNKLGTKLWGARADIDGATWAGMHALNKIIMSFSGARHSYAELLNEPFLKYLPKRKTTEVIRRLLTLEKLDILFKAPTENVTNALRDLRKEIQEFRKSFKGKQPFFVDFLNDDEKTVRSLGILKNTYGGSGGLSGLITKVALTRKKFEEIESQIP